MSKTLQDALNNNAWSVSAVMFDLNAMLDDEGRPISERRADAAVRVGVEMEMQKCPFEGIRNDKWMNVSALTQITAYYKDALAEMSAFRRNIRGTEPSWDDMFACIVDLMAGPATYLLQHRSNAGPVPARLAVCHKLAAGMFGLLRGIHERLARGEDIPISVDSFMDLIEETGALLGATMEACAGSLPMIRKAVAALIDGTDDHSVELDPLRLQTARNLALQVQLGIFWQQYDQQHLWSLVKGEFKQHLVPCNHFLAQKIEREAAELPSAAPASYDTRRLPIALDSQWRTLIANALDDKAEPRDLEQDSQSLAAMLDEPGNVIAYSGDKSVFVRHVAAYLHTYRCFVAAQSFIEQQLRQNLGYNQDAPIKLGAAVLALPRALHWYELIFGNKIGEDGRLSGKSTRARSAVKTG